MGDVVRMVESIQSHTPISPCHRPRRRAIQYAAALLPLERCDHPPARVMTAFGSS